MKKAIELKGQNIKLAYTSTDGTQYLVDCNTWKYGKIKFKGSNTYSEGIFIINYWSEIDSVIGEPITDLNIYFDAPNDPIGIIDQVIVADQAIDVLLSFMNSSNKAIN